MPKCLASNEQFEISADDREFYSRMNVPLPKLSPKERMRRRLAFRHGGQLHHTVCALTGRPIISMYPSSSPFPVYEQAAWWSDAWSGLSFGRDIDFTRSFLDQFRELSEQVPRISLLNTNCENSYYTNHALNVRNGYLLIGASNSEDCLYGYFVISCTDVLDSISVVGCELCYDGVASFDCYECIAFTNSKSCVDCILVEDCTGCECCIACFGLRGAKYHVFNQPLGKAEFLRIKTELQQSRYADFVEFEQRFAALKRTLPRAHAHLYACEDCTGDMLFNSKACAQCFDLRNSENCKFIAFSPNSTHSYDCNFSAPAGVQFSYECVSTLASDSRFNAIVWHANEVDYSIECHYVNNIFGCCGLKKAKFCILNKQYSESDYHALRRKLIEMMKQTGEWGEFFQVGFSPHPYNDSLAQQFFRLEKAEALGRGYGWREDLPEAEPAESSVRRPEAALSEQSILTQIYRCEATGKAFKITPSELRFYQKMSLPLPRFSPEERHRVRFARRAPYQLFPRKCAECGCKLETVYSEQAAPRVLCERDTMGNL